MGTVADPTGPTTTRIVARWIVRETVGVITTAAILFVSAGRWDWPAGWALVAILALWVIGTGAVTIPRHPDLLRERLGPRAGAKTWDMSIMSAVGLLTIARLVVAGLDARFGWSKDFPIPLQVAAGVVCTAGHALVVWATGANAYFSQIVRIQTERGHTVATGGPYRLVRHPAYVGGVLHEVAAPLLLGSWWALLAGGLNAVLFVVRTGLEDRTLRQELAGYPEYAERVRFRLLPGVW
jgi:protein-S-isoprenylcysteine O-methyltransferase Ste14